MFGPVRLISENLKAIGLVKPISAMQPKKPVLAESKPAPKQTTKPTLVAPKVAPKVQPKDRLASLLEQVDSLSNEMKVVFAEAPSQKVRNVLEGLDHIQKVSAAVTKKYAWRQDERSKNIAELFKSIGSLAEGMRTQISSGSLTEEGKIKEDANELIKRFVKAVGVVKEEIGINKDVYSSLLKESDKIK
jgi:hypothetical protein